MDKGIYTQLLLGELQKPFTYIALYVRDTEYRILEGDEVSVDIDYIKISTKDLSGNTRTIYIGTEHIDLFIVNNKENE